MAKKVDLPEPIIPNASWKIVELGDYVKILNGYPFDSGRFKNSSENTFPLIRIRDVVRGYTETFTDEDCPDEYKIKKDEILIGMDGDFNISRWKSDFGLLNQRVCKIKSASKDLDDKFLYYYLPIPLKQINDATPSVTVKHLSSNSLLQLHFPLPPLTEQQRIVNRIETMFAKLDQAQENTQSVLDSFEPRKAAILHKAFTGELTANWRKENGVSDDSWKIVKLEDIVKKEKYSLKAGPFGSALKKEFYVPYGYKIYGQEQVLNSDENYGDYFINEAKYKELESCKIAPNDILISLVGTVGKTLILSDNCKPGIINPRLIKLSLDLTLMLPQFFTYYFGSDYCKSRYMTVQHGTTMDVLNMGILKQLDYPCCSLPEQQEIVRIIDTVLEKETRAKEAAQTVLEQIALLKKSILARAFRGEL